MAPRPASVRSMHQRATSSSFRSQRKWIAVSWVVVVLSGRSAQGTVMQTVDEALLSVFPSADVTRETVFLEEAQRIRAKEIAGVEIDRLRVHPYVARVGDEVVGVGYFDTHRVRTLPETVMVLIDPSGKLREVRVLAFREPIDYIAPDPWYRQFDGRGLSPALKLGSDIQGVTGATLTARATTQAVRRVLAIHATLSSRWFEGAPVP